jgi:dihydroxyacetone kinase-like predicted kinase
MTEAAGAVDTGEVTTAVRDATFDGFKIAEGQSIGLQNGRVVSVGDSVDEAFWGLLGKMSPDTAEIFSLYYGTDCSSEEANALAERIRERYSGAEVEVIDGGQPFYRYVISRE